MAGVVMVRPVAQLLGPDGQQRVREALQRKTAPCQVCGRILDPDVDDIAVRVSRPAASPVTRIVDFTHTGCGPSALLDSPATGIDPVLGRPLDTVAIFGQLHGHPLVACDSGATAYFDVGGQLSDAFSATYLEAGFSLVTTPLEQLEPRQVPVLRGWSVRLDAAELRIAGGKPPHVAYVQQRTAEVADWARALGPVPGPVLVLAGSGLAPVDGGDWSASIDGARLAGRLVAARMPLHTS